MRRIERAAMILALTTFPTPTPAADPPAPARRVDAVLREWEEHASSVTSLDCRFTLTTRSKNWGDEIQEGRSLLGLPNQACHELYTPAQGEKPAALERRLVWTGKEFKDYQRADCVLYVYHYPDEVPDPPGLLCLPFLYKMNAEEAGRLLDWKILSEDNSQIILRATPRSGQASRFRKSSFVIWLDRQTYLPSRFLIEDSPSERQEYVVHSAIPNAPFDVTSYTAPAPAGWQTVSYKMKLSGWLSRNVLLGDFR